MKIYWLLPIFFQAAAILIDEFYFHHRRELPKWERRGHPLDTLGLSACILVAVAFPFETKALYLYIALSILSSLLITKDEWVHAEACSGGEQWVHALLFMVHPLVLISVGFIWAVGQAPAILRPLFALTVIYAGYQFLYWNFIRRVPGEAVD